jgi:hypothetical protein
MGKKWGIVGEDQTLPNFYKKLIENLLKFK